MRYTYHDIQTNKCQRHHALNCRHAQNYSHMCTTYTHRALCFYYHDPFPTPPPSALSLYSVHPTTALLQVKRNKIVLLYVRKSKVRLISARAKREPYQHTTHHPLTHRQQDVPFALQPGTHHTPPHPPPCRHQSQTMLYQ